MSEHNALYLLQNQNNLFLSKSKEWVDATDLSILFRSLFKDEALNQLVEVNSKDITQRIRCIECEPNKQGQPLIDPAIMPEPLPKPVATQAEESMQQGDAIVLDPVAAAHDNAAGETEATELALAD